MILTTEMLPPLESELVKGVQLMVFISIKVRIFPTVLLLPDTRNSHPP